MSEIKLNELGATGDEDIGLDKVPVPESIKFSGGGLSDKTLLELYDALMFSLSPNNNMASECFLRHNRKDMCTTLNSLRSACIQRNIDIETGTKTKTTHIDLLV